MARIRTIKPEIASDVGLARISRESRYTLVLLISQADDQGFLLGNPRQLLGSLFPHDNDVTPEILHGWLAELESAGMIIWRARNDGAPVVQLTNWQRHQKVDHPHKPVLELSLLDADSVESREAIAKVSRNLREGLATPSRPDLTALQPYNHVPDVPSVRKKPRTNTGKYAQDFNDLWARYPKRAGANPRAAALKAYNARREAGVTAAELADGLTRYAAFCVATNKPGTEFVMQGARFFGPSDQWAEAWTIPAPSPRGWQKPEPSPTNRSTGAPEPKSALCPFCHARPSVSAKGRTEVLHESECHMFDAAVLPSTRGDHAA
ncbi:MAG: hypothetical protein C0499_05685 [Zymomonas sp.]|nr:hypothetical protein [Zymomonas sp.]